jgi:hypothetical protein
METTMSATLTNPETHTGPTAAELARRARCRELRELIRKEAGDRRIVKAAYRLPHGSPENKAAMAAARVALKIDPKYVGPWNEHAIPGRDYGRSYVTELHVELATLRGKQHLTAPKLPA